MSANGYLTAAELTTIAPNTQLAHHAANAYFWMRTAFAKEKVTIAPAGGLASGYRSFFVQGDMHKHPGLYDLNSSSSISLASAGYSSHGTGTRLDLLFNGSSWPSAEQLALAHKYGWSREFGADDPNHFMHDGRTAIQPFTTAPAKAHTHQALEIMEEHVNIFRGDKQTAVYALVGGHKRHILHAEAQILRACGSWNVAVVPQVEADAIPTL